ncbi:hypothetical protein JOC75_000675 [Metabacillus crassostreae]|uniref:hypothetical protein n=1 Tax=Metabacillus crassostreae TaxID=929098 RepID=UPI00195E48BB|nr:hypothetical protein [Metabacillus crassostreae]MBM7602705.1 hypothetical protein [Metabacillus crassostreae]
MSGKIDGEKEYFSFENIRVELIDDFKQNNTNGLEDCAHFLIDFYTEHRSRSEEMEMTIFILIAEALIDRKGTSQYVFRKALNYIESGKLPKIWSKQSINNIDIKQRLDVLQKVESHIKLI